MKQLVKNILNFIHILIVLFYFLPLFTNKRNLLIVYLILNVSVLLKWYFFNGCWLTQIQNRIEKKKTLWLPRTIKKITPKKMHRFIDEYFPFIHDTIFIGISGALPSGTGLNLFEENFFERNFDVGIA